MKVMLSECCEGLPVNDTLNGKIGICNNCKNWAEFYSDFWIGEKVIEEYRKGEKNEE